MKKLTTILLAITIFSCSRYPVSEAVKDLNRAYVNYPDTTADLTRAWFPCIVTKSDTVVKTVDSIVYIECPETTGTAEDYAGKDTVTITKVKTVRVPVTLPVKYITIKEKIEDSAKIKSMQTAINEVNDKNIWQQVKIEELNKNLSETKSARNKWRLRFFILLAVFGGAIVLRIKRIL